MPVLFRQSPLLRILIPFSAGLYVSVKNVIPVDGSALILPGIFLASIYILTFVIRASYSFRWIHSVSVLLLAFHAGFSMAWMHNDLNKPYHFSSYPQDFLVVRLLEPPQKTGKTLKVKAEVLSVHHAGDNASTTGKIMLYFKDRAEQFSYGDVLLVKSSPVRLDAPLNPEEFDYAAYLSYRNIYHQAFIESGKWKRISYDVNPVKERSFRLRERLVSILKETVGDADIYSVGSALLVGYEADLEDGLLAAYASSGALHVLSVSGMHVAIIYKVLEWLFSFLMKVKGGRHACYAILLSTLWFYALLSGLSPSVLRATMMISFIIAGKWAGRTSGIVNSITVSCLVLFSINPFLIMEVGFRLSLLAVLGIVLVHPLLFRIYTPPGKLLYGLWSIVSVSLSAQLVTFPIGLFYFHQFPNLFLLSNILIIPATTVAIYSAIILVLMHQLPVIGFLAAKVTYACIWFSNKSAEMIYSMPYSVINGISITAAETWFIYGIIVISGFFLLRRQFIYLCMLLLSLIGFTWMQVYENIRLEDQKMLAVYAVKGHSLINLADGRTHFLLCDSAFLQDARKFQFHLQQHWWKQGWKVPSACAGNMEATSLKRNGNFICFMDKLILIADSAFCSQQGERKLQTDYIILSGNPSVTIEELQQRVSFKKLIIDSSNKRWKCKKWMGEAEKLSVDAWDVMKSGAFCLMLND